MPARQPENVKEANLALLYDVLSRRRNVSRPELASQTGLSRATIALLADELLELGIIREAGLESSSGGRRPVRIRFNPDAAHALGAAMEEYHWTVVRTNLDAAVADQERVEMDGSSPEAAVRAVAEGVRRLRRRSGSVPILPGIGIGAPGLVDIHSGRILSAFDLGWAQYPIGREVEKATGLSSVVANRSKVGALAEYWYSAARDVQDLIYVSVGTGIAAGIIHDGALYIGTNSSAGELGHTTVVPTGPQCACGNRGCLQTLVSERAIEIRARELLRGSSSSRLHDVVGAYPEQLSAEEVMLAAEEDDPVGMQVIGECAEYLGIALGNLTNLFNPQEIVLGGPVVGLSRLLVTLTREQVQRRAMGHPLSALTVRGSELGSEAGAVGASVLVLQHAKLRGLAAFRRSL